MSVVCDRLGQLLLLALEMFALLLQLDILFLVSGELLDDLLVAASDRLAVLCKRLIFGLELLDLGS